MEKVIQYYSSKTDNFHLNDWNMTYFNYHLIEDKVWEKKTWGISFLTGGNTGSKNPQSNTL